MPSSNVTLIAILSDNSKVALTVYAESNDGNSLQLLEESEAMEFGEAPLQLLEGHGYEYMISENYKLGEIPKVVSRSRANESSGRITPNIYVGSLFLKVLDINTSEVKGSIPIEVRSIKASYRKDYRFMLEDITEKCTELLMQHSSPVSQYFTIDFNKDSQTLYQRFAFVKSIVESSDFKEAVHRIVSSPVTKWAEREDERDIRKARRMSNNIMKQLVSGTSRIKLPSNHYFSNKFDSVPAKLRVTGKYEIVDTPENRFVKHVLATFFQFCSDVRSHLPLEGRGYKEAILLEEVLENLISHSLFLFQFFLL